MYFSFKFYFYKKVVLKKISLPRYGTTLISSYKLMVSSEQEKDNDIILKFIT